MYLSRFGVKNYKCLGEIDIPLTPIHVLIGENDAGKTSLLEAMAAFYGSSQGEMSQMFPGAWEGRELVLRGDSDGIVTFHGTWTAAVGESVPRFCSWLLYQFAVYFPQEGKRLSVTHDQIITEGLGPGFSLRPGGSLDPECDSERDLLRTVRKAISNLLKPAQKYAMDARMMAVPAAIDPRRKFRLDPDGFGLATLVDDMLGYDPEIFLKVRQDFCHFFPQFKNLRIGSERAIERDYGPSGMRVSRETTGKGIYFETKSGQTLRAQQVSDGAILFLGFLVLAHLPDPPTILLIEEPENGIYPKRLEEVIKLLKELVTRTEGVRFPQIIMSTHSPYVLSFFEPEEVTFLSRPPDDPDGPVRARPLRDAPEIHERMGGGFYLGELWYNLSEEDLFGEP